MSTPQTEQSSTREGFLFALLLLILAIPFLIAFFGIGISLFGFLLALGTNGFTASLGGLLAIVICLAIMMFAAICIWLFHSKRFKVWTFPATLTLTGGVLFTVHSIGLLPARVDRFFLFLEPRTVTVRTKPLTYTVPSGYFERTDVDEKNNSRRFLIHMHLPDFAPRRFSNAMRFSSINDPDILHVEILLSPTQPQEAVLKRELTQGGIGAENFAPIPSGYRRYDIAHPYEHKIYTKLTESGLFLMICTNINCKINEPLSAKTTVSYNLDLKYADRAAEIDQRLLSLIRSFRQR